MCPPFLLVLETPSGADLCGSYVYCHSVLACVPQSCCAYMALILWYLPSFLALRIFPESYLRLDGRDLVETSHFGLGVLGLLLSAHCQTVSVFIPISCRRRLLCWWLRKALIYQYIRVLLGVTLLLCFFRKIVVIWFFPKFLLTYLISCSWPENMRGVRDVVQLMEWALNLMRFDWLFLQCLSHWCIFLADHDCWLKGTFKYHEH